MTTVSSVGNHRIFLEKIQGPDLDFSVGYSKQEMLPCGFQQFLVCKAKGLEALPTCQKSYCAEIAYGAFFKNLEVIMERAAQLAVRVTKPNARLCSEKNEYTAPVAHFIYA